MMYVPLLICFVGALLINVVCKFMFSDVSGSWKEEEDLKDDVIVVLTMDGENTTQSTLTTNHSSSSLTRVRKS